VSAEREAPTPVIELRDIRKSFGHVNALSGVTMRVYAGQVTCLVGDNGAGKSTLIQILAGVHRPDSGELLVAGEAVQFRSPRDALERGISTVFQDLAMIPLISIVRNFFLGREPVRHSARCVWLIGERRLVSRTARCPGLESTCGIWVNPSARSRAASASPLLSRGPST
jgi:simple sugar transport system ATP-binding protein